MTPVTPAPALSRRRRAAGVWGNTGMIGTAYGSGTAGTGLGRFAPFSWRVRYHEGASELTRREGPEGSGSVERTSSSRAHSRSQGVSYDDTTVQGRGPFAGGFRPQGDPARRGRDARPHGPAPGVRAGQAARGRPHQRLAAHDHPDRRADR